MKADFDELVKLILIFLEDKNIRQKLSYISEKKIGDWEKWLQLELEVFLAKNQKLTVFRERSAIPNQKILKYKKLMYVDILYRRKGTKINSFVYLEIKCTKSVSALIDGMENDIEKIWGIKKSDYDQRSFWCVGFHHACDMKSIEKAKNYGESWFYHYQQVIYLCDCGDEHTSLCQNQKIGLLIC